MQAFQLAFFIASNIPSMLISVEQNFSHISHGLVRCSLAFINPCKLTEFLDDPTLKIPTLIGMEPLWKTDMCHIELFSGFCGLAMHQDSLCILCEMVSYH